MHIPAKGELLIAVLRAAFPAIPETAHTLRVSCSTIGKNRNSFVRWGYKDSKRTDSLQLSGGDELMLIRLLAEMGTQIPRGIQKLVIEANMGEVVRISCDAHLLIDVDAPESPQEHLLYDLSTNIPEDGPRVS